MKYKILILTLLSYVAVFAQNEKSPLGINIGSPVAWQNDWQFVNIAHHSLAWFPKDADLTWGTWFQSHELQNNSYPFPGTDATLCPIWDSPRVINQDFVLTWEGKADVELVNHWSSPQLLSKSDNRAEIRMDEDYFLFIKFYNTDATEPLRNVRLVKKEHETLSQTYTPEFLDLLSPFKVYRFMDYMQTNGSAVVNREDYSADDNLFRSQVPLESMIELVNIQNADPWFCIPLTASDDFVAEFIAQACEDLNSGKTIYIELSNEVWNGIFDAHVQAADAARALGLTDSPNNWEAAPVYYGYRSAQIHDISDSLIKANGSNFTLKRVLAWQSVNTYFVENYIMPWYTKTAKSATVPDAFAIAPYFGYQLGSPENANDVSTWSSDKVIEQVLDGKYLDGHGTIEEAISSLEAYKTLQEKYGVKSLMSYEAGQHIVGHGGAENNETLTSLFIDANRNQGMYDAYIKYLDAWKKAGGKLCVIFSSHGTYSKWGSWGLKEYISQDNSTTPKYRACLDFVTNNPANWSGDDFSWAEVSVSEENKSNFRIYPNPASDFIRIYTEHDFKSIEIFDLNGVTLQKTTSKEIDVSDFAPGTYIIKISTRAETVFEKFNILK